ncbi:hypothetical protein [Sulfuricurvum sp.]|uniref:hypothetical protein n=1 Tax=Sulfuricurvum sp. TaxID=2025608 RepID=UPI002636D1A0|nr:hypothetical protein [Sulfuricurvum sp.]MDD3594841.1 hypothetical protein [Sulfuricurvum sp.]
MKDSKTLYLIIAIGCGIASGYWMKTPSAESGQAVLIAALSLVFIGIAGLIGKRLNTNTHNHPYENNPEQSGQ